MRNNYKICRLLLLFLLLQYTPFFIKAQVTFQKVYPTTIRQSGKDVLPTSDGGYLIAGMTTTTIVGDSDIYLIKTDYSGNILWTKTYGGSLPDYPHALIRTNDSNYFMLGFTKSYGAGGADIWLLKIDPSGTLLWSKAYGGTGDESGHEIIPTSDGNYAITGRSNNDAYLLKINPAGNTIWTKSYGGSQYETSHSVKQCLDGGYILVGKTFSYGQGAGDIYVVKTNSTGDTTWTKTFGGIYDDEAGYVLANPDGTYTIDAQISSNNLLSGLDIYVVKIDANGNSIWTKTYGGNDKDVTHNIQPTSDHGYIIAGISRSFGWINPDMWLVKIDSVGNVMWTRNYGSWFHDHCYVVKQTSDGGYIALGHEEDSNSITHVFFIKLNGLGQLPVEEFAMNNIFTVYPNPTTGLIKINLGFVEKGSIFKIYNALGQVVFLETVESSQTVNVKIIDMKDREPGIYFVSIQSAKQLTTKKIILK